MPLKRGRSKAVIRENTREMIHSGHDPAQAYAAANRQAGRHPHKNLGHYLHPKKKKR